MSRSYHFYQVFNPMINNNDHYKTQAHEFYSELKNKVQTMDGDKSFMYWGKIKVDDEQSQDFERYKEVITKNKQNSQDTHLFISDYHHFWVAKVESVHKEIYNKDHSLSFYDNKNVDVWFKITDMDLISAEFEETLFYLSRLFVNNEFQNQKLDSIHPYLGGLKFPMIVEDKMDEKYFKNLFIEDALRLTRNNPLIDNFQKSQNLKGQVKSFVLPPQVFSKLSHTVKKELLSVELSLASMNDENIYTNVLGTYLRILESVMNESLGKILRSQYGDCIFIHEDGSSFSDHSQSNYILLNNFNKNIPIKAFANLLDDVSKFGNLSLDDTNNKFADTVEYFKHELIPFIHSNEIVALRSSLSKGENIQINQNRAMFIRNQILGVGCVGIINNLITLLFKSEEIYYLSQAS